jgi:hypothetical protein
MANQKSCDTCEHFDPVLRGKTGPGGMRETVWGWCARRSTYPAAEGPGQRFPDGVARAEPGELAKPYIVKKGQVLLNCFDHSERSRRPSKIELLKMLQQEA